MIARLKRRALAWTQLWDEREPPTLLALIRIALPLVVLFDLGSIGVLGAQDLLWSGGALSAGALWLGLVVSALGVAAGCFTRPSALAFVALSAHTAVINSPGDRAIDRAIRIVFLILALSPADRCWSVAAKRRTGSFRGDASDAPAWPRYLILTQLMIIYFGAGLAKGGTHWYPWGGYRALYLTLRDPIFAAADFSWLYRPIPYFITQLATASTHLWELMAPLVLVAAHYRRTAEQPGKLRRLFNRLRVRDAYVVIGIAFHLSLALTLRLGIFPFAMLACFPAFFRPDELERAAAALLARASAFVRLDPRRRAV